MTAAKTEKLESDDDEDQDSETSTERKYKWYIERNGSPIHIKKALKLLFQESLSRKNEAADIGLLIPFTLLWHPLTHLTM